MANPSPSQRIHPANPDFPPSNPKNPDSAGITSATFGLPRAWMPILEWAVGHRVTRDLALIINATCIQNKPDDLGQIIECFANEESLNILRGWSRYSETAHSLLRFSEVAYLNPLPLRGAITKFTPSREMYRGTLDTHYLLALISERTPKVDVAQHDWLIRLRLWTTIQSLTRALRQNVQDKSLNIVASKLRMAFDCDNDWRKLFCLKLYCNASDFDEDRKSVV